MRSPFEVAELAVHGICATGINVQYRTNSSQARGPSYRGCSSADTPCILVHLDLAAPDPTPFCRAQV